MTPQKPPNSKDKGTPKLNQKATPSRESRSSHYDDAGNEEYFYCIVEYLDLNQDINRIFHHEMLILACHLRTSVTMPYPSSSE